MYILSERERCHANLFERAAQKTRKECTELVHNTLRRRRRRDIVSTQDDLQQNLTGFGLFNHRGRNEAGRTHSLEKARRVCVPLLWSSFFDGTCTNSIPLQGAVGSADQRRRPGTLPSRPCARSERPSLAYREKHHHHTSTRPSERPNSGSRASSFERALHTTAKPRLVHPVVRVFVWCVYLLGTRRGAITGFPSVLRAWSFFQSQQDQSGFTSVSLLFFSRLLPLR